MNLADHEKYALELYQAGKYGECINFLNGCSEVFTHQTYLIMAYAEKESNSIDRAIANLEKSLEMNAKNPPALLEIANLFASKTDYKQSVKYLKKLLKLDKTNAIALSNLGLCLHAQKSNVEAEKCLVKAIKLAPTYAEPLLHLSRIHISQGKFASARKMISKSLKLNPTDPQAYKLLGSSKFYEGEYAEAIKDFHRAKGLEPTSAEVEVYIINCLRLSGKVSQAQKHTKLAYEKYPNSMDIASQLLADMLAHGQISDGEAFLREQKLRGELPSEWSQFFEAKIHLAKADYEAGIEMLISLIHEANTAQSIVLESLVILAHEYRITDPERLEDLVPETQKISDDVARIQIKAYIEAQYYLNSGQVQKAQKALGNILSNQHYIPDFIISEMRAKLYERNRQFDQAYKAFSLMNEQYRIAKAITHEYQKAFFLEGISGEEFQKESNQYRECEADPSVFYIGFPRSGTTLLTNMLNAHSKITIVDEKPFIDQAYALYRETGSVTQARELYRREVRAAKLNKGVIIDKLPLAMVKTKFIKALFPNVKFVLAIRHPNDCVLSAFQQWFTLNKAMSNTLSLKEATNLYDRCFDVFYDHFTAIEKDIFCYKYEDLVEKPFDKVEEILNFLCLDFEDEVRSYRDVISKKRIATPSLGVKNEIVTTNRYRWMAYKKFFESEKIDLSYWIKKFGY